MGIIGRAAAEHAGDPEQGHEAGTPDPQARARERSALSGGRKALPDLRRTADMVFRPAKVAVFIDGCYWHGCPEHYVSPKTNPGYWSEKVARNVARDRDTDERLSAAGWLVLRFWEHQSSDACALSIISAVRERRNDLPG